MAELSGTNMDYLAAFEKFNSEFPIKNEIANRFRQDAFEFFKKHGLPTRKIENWKYTGLKVLSENSFFPARPLSSLPQEIAAKIESFQNDEILDLVFFNGQMRPELSTKSTEGFSVKKSLIKSEEESISNLPGDLHFQALNGMFANDEIEIVIADKVTLNRPLRLFFFTHLNDGPSLMIHPRVRLKVGESAKATVIESHCNLEKARYFVNSLVQIEAKKHSNLSYVFYQEQSETAVHVAQSLFNLAEASRLQIFSFHTGSLISRHNVEVNLTQENSEADLLGLAVLSDSQHCDNKTLIRHSVGHCTTRQIYKSILSGESRYVFSGKIKIAPGAQKASSEQLNKNLLISTKAEVNSEPQLEVEADDVKATHGSTVGQLSEEEIFYFKSRGISREKALDLLSFGFAADLVERIESKDVQKWLKEQLKKSFFKLSQESPKKAKSLGEI